MRWYMRKRWRSDWCCRASDFSSRIHLCVLSFSPAPSFSLFFPLSSLSRAKTSVSALPHASRNWSRECNRASSCCSGSDSCNATAMRITRRIITTAPLSSRVAVPRLPTLVSSETCVLYQQRVPCLDAAERCSRFCTPAKIMTGGITGSWGETRERERSGCCGSWFYGRSSFRSFFREDKGGI